MQLANNRKNQMNRIVWLTVFLLSVLVVATIGVVTSCIYGYAHQSDCQISLYKGSSNSRVSILKNKSVLGVNDSKRVWKTKTPIELFKASYVNDQGVVSVQSADGQKVVAPGTEGKYSFRLKNSSTASCEYMIWVKSELNSSLMNVPMQVRMSDGQNWILGSENAWVRVDRMDGVSSQKSIGAGKSVDYTIYWKWPYEDGMDTIDSSLANQDLTYTLTIYTLTQTDGDVSLDGVNTGVQSGVVLWFVVMVVSGCLLILVLKRRKNEKDEQKN